MPDLQLVESQPEREVWYRVEAGHNGPRAEEFPVLRHTQCGVWLQDYWKERFVLKGARKRFAYPTKEEAMESFIARKKRQERILRYQLRNVRRILAQVGAEPFPLDWEEGAAHVES